MKAIFLFLAGMADITIFQQDMRFLLILKCLTKNYRLATVASGAASGKLLQYEVGGPRVSVQTAYGVEVEVGK